MILETAVPTDTDNNGRKNLVQAHNLPQTNLAHVLLLLILQIKLLQSLQ